MTTVTRVGDQTDILGESPLWNERDQCLYWVDIRRPAVRRYHHASGRIDTWTMPDLVGCIAFCTDGRLLVALPDQLAFFDTATTSLQPFVATPQPVAGHRFNDGRCDRQGRFWVGTMHNVARAPEGILYRVDAHGKFAHVASNIRIPNSLGWSPDGRTMYFADSLQYAIFAYDFDPASGDIGRRRVFATTSAPAFPDGSTVDAEGFLWNAEFNGGRVVRYAPDGRIDRIIELPTHRPTCCAFGGPNLDTLYITTASQQMAPDEMANQPLAGALLAIDVGVRGLVEPRFVATADPTWE
ncbi:MAG TPA: SMP-30/gluconolactonase/LRE family protein [Casimicrobiaceae bacterium]|nr:SMP-30/gluconolactonase/LRE family protein [Casimicrobiaceae bacterium]